MADASFRISEPKDTSNRGPHLLHALQLIELGNDNEKGADNCGTFVASPHAGAKHHWGVAFNRR
jgi:hypothetical protein